MDLHAALKGNRRSQTSGRQRQVLGKALVVAQISVSLLLLAGSALLVRSAWSLRHQDFGFRGENVPMVELPWEFSPAMMARYAALSQPLYDRMNQLPAGALMKEVGLLVSASAGLGGAEAVAMTRALHTMLFGFGPGDYSPLLAVALFLVVVASLAGFLPARRAARLDPMEALRES